jgi:2-polyprenyl-3-methyl-5-hydroxy-6-metoxy-1,4-benzoquinol methylase
VVDRHPNGLQRRVAGFHDIRLDGIGDLLFRAQGASVMDLGCNRGLVGFEFANNGARLVHGCDIFEEGINTARQIFADLRAVQSQFEVVDLTLGEPAFEVFGSEPWDIVLMLALYHKLARQMAKDDLSQLIRFIGSRTARYFAWRGYDSEIKILDEELRTVRLRRVHTSFISKELGASAIWERR